MSFNAFPRMSSTISLNESPSEKEGKYEFIRRNKISLCPLNESPSEKEGK